MNEQPALVALLESLLAEWESGQIADHKIGRWAIADLRHVVARAKDGQP